MLPADPRSDLRVFSWGVNSSKFLLSSYAPEIIPVVIRTFMHTMVCVLYNDYKPIKIDVIVLQSMEVAYPWALEPFPLSF